jgi:hypothetical protein
MHGDLRQLDYTRRAQQLRQPRALGRQLRVIRDIL